jgi:hypothetical protein
MMGGGLFDMFSQFDDMFASHANAFGGLLPQLHSGGMPFTTSSLRSGGGGGGVFESVSTVTEIRNGQRVTKTVRRSQDANGVVREHVDEEVAEVPQRYQRLDHGPYHHHHGHDSIAAAGGRDQFHTTAHGVPQSRSRAAIPQF